MWQEFRHGLLQVCCRFEGNRLMCSHALFSYKRRIACEHKQRRDRGSDPGKFGFSPTHTNSSTLFAVTRYPASAWMLVSVWLSGFPRLPEPCQEALMGEVSSFAIVFEAVECCRILIGWDLSLVWTVFFPTERRFFVANETKLNK